jgi:transcriptional regulator with XRE-family HTH domain
MNNHTNSTLIKLGARIKKIRSAKNLSQYELAMLCGFEKANMSRLESGQSNPTVLTLLRISEALNTPLEEFFKDEKEPVIL